jgi:hypothetical protein
MLDHHTKRRSNAQHRLTREQIRALRRLRGQIDDVSDDDRRWFERHFWRSYRLRPISEVERRQQEIMWPGRRDVSQFVGARDCVIVEQIRPGERLRICCACVLFVDCEELSDQDIVRLRGGL